LLIHLTLDEVNIANIRRFLEPQDRVVKRMLSRREASGYYRTEFTCEWFENHLATFTRGTNKMLLVTGGPASGKTVLSDWIVEYLQGSLEKYPYSVLYYSFGE
jgi:Cdc6-like AAA superfamily ATPase